MDWSSFSIGNAAGFIKGQGKQFSDILRSAVTDITIGSITVEPCEGNIALGTIYHLDDDGTSVNALGLPNPGLIAIKQQSAVIMASQAREYKKNLWWSIAGFSPEEYQVLAFELAPHGGIELNLGCPNVWKGEEQKPIASFNLSLIDDILRRTQKLTYDRKLRLKVSPYSDPLMLQEVAAIVKKSADHIDAIVTCNTFPNGIAMTAGTARILDTSGGYGGVGGSAMHRIALGQVSQWRASLKGTGIKVIGVGGVNTGEHLANMVSIGADGVQVGTHYGENGAGAFSELLGEATNYI
jgi:dihydroorotate dehydrogenase